MIFIEISNSFADIIRDIWGGFDFTELVNILVSLVPSLLCITFHELCHGFTAKLLGDDTAQKAGRLTLNPIKHIDITGLLMMTIFHVGWAKPVPVNMRKFKNPKRGMAVTALAGPVSNILLALIFIILYGFFYIPLYISDSKAGEYVLNMLLTGAYISTGLAVFNLIPVPPLDGSKVLFSVISDEAYYKLMKYEKYGALVLFVLVATGVLGKPVSSAVSAVFGLMSPLADTMAEFYLKLFPLA